MKGEPAKPRFNSQYRRTRESYGKRVLEKEFHSLFG